MKYLERKAIEYPEEIDATPVQVYKCWIDLITDYLKDGALPEDKRVVKMIKYISNRYVIMKASLYKRGYVIPFLLCLHPHQAQMALLEIHEGLCGSHPTARSLTLKVGRQGYF